MQAKLTSRFLLTGWLLVAGWFASVPGLLPAAFMAAAWFDGEHGIELRTDADAATVVLTHGTANAGKCHQQIHRHHALARLLTSCATSAGREADHLVHFSSARLAEAARKATLPPATQESEAIAPPPQTAELVLGIPNLSTAPEFRAAAHARALLPRLPGLQHALLI
jgi:hypothetical protein